MARIHYAGSVWGKEEQGAAIECVLSMRFTLGDKGAAFEKGIAEVVGMQHGVFVNSGSSANLLAVAGLAEENLKGGIGRGDEVITVAACFPTTVFPILQYGAVPVFVDVDIPGYNVNIEALESAITDKTKAISLAHTMGEPFNVEEVQRLCQEHGLLLLEDACDAIGSRYKGMPVGSFGDVSTFSFYPAHIISTGEGGLVCTNSDVHEKAIRSLRDWGRDCTCRPAVDNSCGKRFSQQFGTLPYGFDHKYVSTRVGYNLKGTEMQAAIGIEQLKRLSGFIEKRRDNWRQLRDELVGMEDVLILPEENPDTEPCWFAFMITARADGEGKYLVEYLEENGIQTRRLFAGNITRQPCMDGREYRVVGSLDNTDKVMHDTFAVGVWPGLGEEEMTYIADKLKAFYGR